VVTFDGQSGDATCEACDARRYLTAPPKPYPTAGIGQRAGLDPF
jgi:hypothetical protein